MMNTMIHMKHSERASSFYFQWILLLSALFGGMAMDVVNLRTYEMSVGVAFRIECDVEEENVGVTWSSDLHRSLENISGIKIKGNSLWFLPAKSVHSGKYSCLSSKGNDSWEMMFNISVEDESCPRMNRDDPVKSTWQILCRLEHIFQLDPQAQVSWLKNCSIPTGGNGTILYLNQSEDNIGLYTCFVRFTFEGESYSAAQTTKISYPPNNAVTQPNIIYPKQDKQIVVLGESVDLKCKALIGQNGEDETEVYWTFNNTEPIEPISEKNVIEDNRTYRYVNVNIPEVKEEHLNTNFTCAIDHPAGSDYGNVILILANQNERYLWIILGVVCLFVLVAAGFYFFKVDLVLAYRHLCSPVHVHTDEKSYDAYVSYLHGDQRDLSSTMSFALRSLPDVLEKRYGYKLFISGRDELPGEAVHDVVAEKMNQSRRLIIVLTSQSFDSQTKKPLLSDGVTSGPDSAQIWGTYEQRVGLYDALVKQGLKVILVQVEDGVEESSLPESLRYISRSKGILRWRQDVNNRTNRRFWKHLRYQMPPGQKKKSQQITELQQV